MPLSIFIIGEPCKCAIPQTYLDNYDVATILKNADLFEMIYPHIRDKDDDFKLRVLHAIEDPGIVGEMLTSAGEYYTILCILSVLLE